MKKFLKENWFVVVVAIFFVCISIFYAYDQHKDDLKGKVENGKDVVYSIGDENVTADELYDDLYKQYGEYLLTIRIMNSILDANVKLTDELANEVNNIVASYVSYYSYYGGLDYLNSIAVSYGYDDFKSYMKYSVFSRELSSKYINEHLDEYVTDAFLSKYTPRTISYCLIKFEDPANPTADETKRFEDAKTAWASADYSAENFAAFAKKYSEDSSTASSGGKLGYVDTESSLVKAFLEEALKLNAGEVSSDWVFSEEYGYFLIKCDSTNVADFNKDSDFVSRVLTEYENLSNQILWHYAQQCDIKFADEKVKEYFLNELGVKEDQ